MKKIYETFWKKLSDFCKGKYQASCYDDEILFSVEKENIQPSFILFKDEDRNQLEIWTMIESLKNQKSHEIACNYRNSRIIFLRLRNNDFVSYLRTFFNIDKISTLDNFEKAINEICEVIEKIEDKTEQ